MPPTLPDRLASHYPVLAEIDPAERSAVLAAQAQFVSVAAGTLLLEQHAPCRGFPMVLRGAVRVARATATEATEVVLLSTTGSRAGRLASRFAALFWAHLRIAWPT